MANPSEKSIGKLVRGISAAIAGWNDGSEEPEYADVRDGALAVYPIGANVLVASHTAVWASSAPANTAVDVDIEVPAPPSPGGAYILLVKNPSAVTDLTVTLLTRVGAECFELTRFSVAKQTNRSINLQGWLLADGGRIRITNDTAIGAGQGFTANIFVYRG